MPDAEHTPVDGPDEAERREHAEFVESLAPTLNLSAGLADALDDVASYTATTDRLAHLLHLREGLRAALAAGANRRSTRAADTRPQSATTRSRRSVRSAAHHAAQPAWSGGHLATDTIVAYIDEELSPGARRSALEHLARCPDCAAEVVAQTQARWALRASAATPSLPSTLLSSLRAIPREAELPAPPPGLAVGPDGRLVSVLREPGRGRRRRRSRTDRRMRLGAGAADLTDDYLLRPRAEPPTTGWRAAVYAASGGRINPGVSEAEAARNVLLRRIRRHLPGAHQIAVSSLKGGVGKTTIAAMLGLTLAEHRGDRVIAVDANPDAGTLADRLTGEIGVTVRQMLDNIDSIDSLTAISRYTSLAGRLQVLASEQDPAMSEAFNRDEYEQICSVLSRFYNIIITDSGTGLVHSAMEGTLALADSLVVVGAPTVDGASRASKTLDWLIAHGYAEQVADAVMVLCCDRVSPEIDRERVRAHFLGRTRAVVEIPYDPHLATGGRLDLTAMREPTRYAFLQLAAHIADKFSAPTSPTGSQSESTTPPAANPDGAASRPASHSGEPNRWLDRASPRPQRDAPAAGHPQQHPDAIRPHRPPR